MADHHDDDVDLADLAGPKSAAGDFPFLRLLLDAVPELIVEEVLARGAEAFGAGAGAGAVRLGPKKESSVVGLVIILVSLSWSTGGIGSMIALFPTTLVACVYRSSSARSSSMSEGAKRTPSSRCDPS